MTQRRQKISKAKDTKSIYLKGHSKKTRYMCSSRTSRSRPGRHSIQGKPTAETYKSRLKRPTTNPLSIKNDKVCA